jgi:hypothetical protein
MTPKRTSGDWPGYAARRFPGFVEPTIKCWKCERIAFECVLGGLGRWNPPLKGAPDLAFFCMQSGKGLHFNSKSAPAFKFERYKSCQQRCRIELADDGLDARKGPSKGM